MFHLSVYSLPVFERPVQLSSLQFALNLQNTITELMMAEANVADESTKAGMRKRLRRAQKVDDNPCSRESQMSYQCLSDNGYDKDRCVLFFENYKNCMSFWSGVRRDRRSKGIKPYTPDPEDRDRVKQEYLDREAGRV